MKKPKAPLFKVGDRIFDRASNAEVTVLGIHFDETDIVYETDAKPDATGDGAFPDGHRNDFEVCAIDDTQTRNSEFIY